MNLFTTRFREIIAKYHKSSKPAWYPGVSLNIQMSAQSKQGTRQQVERRRFTFRLSHSHDISRLVLCLFPVDCPSRLFNCREGPVKEAGTLLANVAAFEKIQSDKINVQMYIRKF